ncbi:hypothetical protein Hanom_Chr02g00159751 [Helianthus anomalus]
MTLEVSSSKHVSYPSLMAMGICRQGSLSGGELGREIPSAVRGTVQLPFFKIVDIFTNRYISFSSLHVYNILHSLFYVHGAHKLRH